MREGGRLTGVGRDALRHVRVGREQPHHEQPLEAQQQVQRRLAALPARGRCLAGGGRRTTRLLDDGAKPLHRLSRRVPERNGTAILTVVAGTFLRSSRRRWAALFAITIRKLLILSLMKLFHLTHLILFTFFNTNFKTHHL